MLDFGHLPTATGNSDVQIFAGQSTVAGGAWVPWIKPRGKSMIDILLIGKGGNGGLGVVGANSVSAGGGGGGSGGQTRLTMPLALLPDTLWLSLAGQSATTTLASYIAIAPPLGAGGGVPTPNDCLMTANGGGNGGNGAAGVGGTAGGAGAIAAVTVMPIGWAYSSVLAGAAGIAGGAAVAGANLTLPITGLLVCGGTGGGGLPAAAATGTNGGSITGAGSWPTLLGGVGSATATVPAQDGNGGLQPQKFGRWYGGTGGASTHGTALTTGLVGSYGGNGAYGCGGGGNGGALTTTPVLTNGGWGGAAIAIITCW